MKSKEEQEVCPHLQFEVSVDVTRLDGIITGYCADVKVRCHDCGLPFEFIGVPNGYSPDVPMASFDFKKICLPMRPNTDRVATKMTYQVKPTETNPINLN